MNSIHFAPRLVLLVAFICTAGFTYSQTTVFTYQGKLTESGSPATGTYLMEFKLFDAVSGGTQIGPIVSNPAVDVANGFFTVSLDFGSSPFSGADRYLEIAVKRNAGDTFTILSPRQQIASSPYAIQTIKAQQADLSLDSQKLGGIPANQFLTTTCVGCVQDQNINSLSGAKVSGVVPNAANSVNSSQLGGIAANQYVTTASVGNTFIKNTNTPQTADFNVTGNGSVGGTFSAPTINANTLNAVEQFNVNGSRILANTGSENLFAGVGAGLANTGTGNAFFGFGAGQVNTSGEGNSFFGRSAGNQNTQGTFNSFFGDRAGRGNIDAAYNSFFGSQAGYLNNSAYNSFFGALAGQNNTTGSSNTFVGFSSGSSGSTGNFNSFVGMGSGIYNTGNNNSFFGYQTGLSQGSGSFNTLLGAGSNVISSDLTFATALGAGAVVGTSNTVMLGRFVDTVRVPGSIDIFGPVTGSFILAAVNGGTGLNSSGPAGNFLRSNGSDWTRSSILSSDVPAGSNYYIQNTTTQQPANFSINGNGFVGGNLSVSGSLNVVGPVTGGFVLSPVNGGTGLNSSGPTGNFLKSDGTSWFSSSIQSNDVPSGSSYYIQNTNSAQTANFNVTGNGLIGGDLAIGTSVPNPNFKLDVAGLMRTYSQTGGNILTVETFGGPGAQAWLRLQTLGRSWVLGTQRSSFNNQFYIRQYDVGSPIRLAINPDNGPVEFPTGDVIIGASSSASRLILQGESSTGAGTASISSSGNATQSVDKGGWAKALIYVDYFTGNIVRCYNGVTGASVVNGSTNTGCGFTVTKESIAGPFLVTFPFNVNDRYIFVSANLEKSNLLPGAVVQVANVPTSTIRVFTFDPETSANVPYSFSLSVF